VSGGDGVAATDSAWGAGAAGAADGAGTGWGRRL